MEWVSVVQSHRMLDEGASMRQSAARCRASVMQEARSNIDDKSVSYLDDNS